jgi:hypothetical protein
MKISRLENDTRGEFKLSSLIAKSLLDSVCSSSESNRINQQCTEETREHSPNL